MPLLLLDVVGKLAVLSVLHDEEEVLGSLDDLVSEEYLVQLDDVRMLHFGQDVYFSADAHQVVVFLDLDFLQDLDRDLLPRCDVDRFLHLAERSLAESSEDDVLLLSFIFVFFIFSFFFFKFI